MNNERDASANEIKLPDEELDLATGAGRRSGHQVGADDSSFRGFPTFVGADATQENATSQ